MNGVCRPETGPMQFGNDWRGVFIRGDSAGWFAINLRMLLEGSADTKAVGTPAWNVSQLLSTLENSRQDVPTEVQQMKAFEDCMDSGNPKPSDTSEKQTGTIG